ncbi:MAG: hypothetical protein N3A69_15690 [Leptospiraceae bacterium]|nr:hypothetical protein [Leptospiraceae bacterium]
MKISSKLCFLCDEEQSPPGKIDNRIPYSLTCGKEYSHFLSNSWMKDVLSDLIKILDIKVSLQEI